MGKNQGWLAEFDRRVSNELMTFMATEAGRSLIGRRERQNSKPLFDVQLRSDLPKSARSWASLYYGLTTVLNVEESKGKFRLKASKTYTSLDSWKADWQKQTSLESLLGQWSNIENYLGEVIYEVKPRFTGKEGQIHAALCCGESDAFRVINREASPTFSNSGVKTAVKEQLYRPLQATIDDAENEDPWWPRGFRIPESPDVLAVDVGGRLAVVEAKHHDAMNMMAEVPLQASYYARLFAWLLATDEGALGHIETMLAQRAELGLSQPGVLHLLRPARVVPVVAIGPHAPSDEAHRRFWEVARAVNAAPSAQTIEPIELWYIDEAGRIVGIERAGDVSRA